MLEGRIIKALSGFYYVEAETGVYQCRGRGVFRNRKITPLVGDFVSFEADDKDEGYILDISPRKNELTRPPIANIDQAIIVNAAVTPDFSTLLLDRFLVLIESKDIEPIIFITKMDVINAKEMAQFEHYQKDYRNIGYMLELVSSKDPDALAQLKKILHGKVSVIAGQSGVGKSSILNALKPSLLLKTDEISNSLGRGKHTTRHIELLEVDGGLVADTPGFSALDFQELEAEELGDQFPEIREQSEYCKFRGCMHHKEPKCAVKQAVESGEIALYRYEHYVTFLDEIQSRKPRY